MSIIEKAIDKVTRVAGEADARSVAQEHRAVSRTSPEPIPGSSYTGAPAPPDTSAANTITIDFEQLRETGVLPPIEQELILAEQYRRIKRPLLSNAYGRGAPLVERGNLIQVTSAVPGEGKTFTAINLALSIAKEQDHTVLLIDADLAMSRITRAFGLTDSPGLSDLLAGSRSELADLVVSTDIAGLSVVPAGTHRSEAAELFGGNKMGELIRELTERYRERVIIFDSPPVLAAAESHVLATLVGQIVLVVEAERTLQHVVKDAIATLDRSKAIGLVFNKSHQIPGAEYYGSYYGHAKQ